ncbi:hypothetical protein GCM10018785_05320 [Streptomyces longispororuber]|uniref:Uncharacterized protein n=1 Tax=Streptomyces longispororuber TaxID=68230 RepID=A0A919DFS1_9ACTN|nr:hypothetical protein GCM10018785_05320 [Streptomyces longispororuber]
MAETLLCGVIRGPTLSHPTACVGPFYVRTDGTPFADGAGAVSVARVVKLSAEGSPWRFREGSGV